MQRKARVTDTRHHLSPLFFSSRMKSGHRVGWRHLHAYKRIRAFRPRASPWFPSLASLLSHSLPQVDRNSRWILIRSSEKRSLSLSLFLSKIWPTMAPVNGRGLRVTSCFVLHRFKAGLSVRRGCPSVFLCFLAIGRGLNPTFVHVSNLFPVRTLARRTCVCDRSIKKKVLKIPFLLIIRYIANTFFNFSERFEPTKQAWTYFVIRSVNKFRNKDCTNLL